MIRIDLAMAMSLYLSFSIILVFAFWIFYTKHNKNIISEFYHLQQCLYCTYLFFNVQGKDIHMCPHCKSYITSDQLINIIPAKPHKKNYASRPKK